MAEKLISADNHIDLTYMPQELWSAQAPEKWREMVPRTVEKEDGIHWLVDGHDKGMWNGIGPNFFKFQKGFSEHVDVMKEAGFEWDHRAGAVTRPTDPKARLADLDKDGVQAEIVYGCLMINDMIPDREARAWANRVYNDWAIDFAKRADPNRVFPLAIIPNNSPKDAADEIRRCAKLGIRGGDLSFKAMPIPLWHHDWYEAWQAAAECNFPISFHSTGFKGIRNPDTQEQAKEYYYEHRMVRSALFQLDTMEVLVSIICSGACEKYPDFKFVLGESGVTWLPYVFDRMDVSYDDRAKELGLKMKPSDYFRRQGFVTYQQDAYLEPNVPLVGEDNIMWGSDYPHPDCLWPDSPAVLAQNLAGLSPATRRKIVHDNVAKLYNIK